MNSRKIFGLIIGVLIYSLCVVGFTFAYYNWRSPGNDVAVGFTVDDLGGAIIYSRDNGESGNGVISGTLNEENGYKTSGQLLYIRKI